MARYRFINHCLSKAVYPDSASCDRARVEKQKSYGKNLMCYMCRFCRKWHLTSNTK
jgi:hypothetical protein